MALSAPPHGHRVRPVSARHFVRLKLRVIGNGLRGQTWRIALFVARRAVRAVVRRPPASSCFAAARPRRQPDGRRAGRRRSAAALLVLGWLLLPLVFFGVDETLDPARFALLPLPRRTLVTGLFAAALIGLPAAGHADRDRRPGAVRRRRSAAGARRSPQAGRCRRSGCCSASPPAGR